MDGTESYVTHSERVEKLIVEALMGMNIRGLVEEHPFTLLEEIANVCIDYAAADVSLGIEIGQAMRAGQSVFRAQASDLDDRIFHFFFIADDEDELVRKVEACLGMWRYACER